MFAMIMLGFLLLFMVSITSAMRRAARRRQEMQELARREAEAGGGPASPFAGMPFGLAVEQMMQGDGWARSLAYDPRTGEWIDMTGAAASTAVLQADSSGSVAVEGSEVLLDSIPMMARVQRLI